MKTTLEIFYVRIAGKSVRYQRREIDLSRKGGDPDHLIWSRIRQEPRDTSEEPEEHEYIVHSTSWRYERPGKIVLTYVAYSDELEFQRGKVDSLPVKDLGTITKSNRKPRSGKAVERKVVAHAMRHLAFLIQTDESGEFRESLAPRTVEVFEKLWIALAGQVFEKDDDSR